MYFARYPKYHPPQTWWVICTDYFRLEKVKRSWLDLGSTETDKRVTKTYPRQDCLEAVEGPLVCNTHVTAQDGYYCRTENAESEDIC